MNNKPEVSSSHLLLVPSYNTGALLQITIEEALQQWWPVWVIIDGSDDGSDTLVSKFAHQLEIRLPLTRIMGAEASNIGSPKIIASGLPLERCINCLI
jgi:glycosyltransferase involved in cell wall biosynthesis